jgi:hypothetical protein
VTSTDRRQMSQYAVVVGMNVPRRYVDDNVDFLMTYNLSL